MRIHSPRFGPGLVALTLAALFAVTHVAAAAAKPWLGVYTQEITGDLRDGMDLPDATGVLVNRVVSDGPADHAGLQQGDVIVRFNSRAVESPEALARLVGDAREGQEVALEISRHGERRTISVTLASRSDDDSASPPAAPEPPPAPGERSDRSDRGGREPRDVRVKVFRNGDGTQTFKWDGNTDHFPDNMREMLHGVPGLDGNGGLQALRVAVAGRGRLGVRIESLNGDLASALGAPDADGVLVLQVMPDTPAERAGLKSGDVILTADGHDVKNAEGLVEALRDVDGKVSLTVSRKGARRTVEAELAAAPRLNRGDWPKAGPGRMGEPDAQGRLRDRDSADNGDLRQQMNELRQQLRELRQQLEEQRHPQ